MTPLVREAEVAATRASRMAAASRRWDTDDKGARLPADVDAGLEGQGGSCEADEAMGVVVAAVVIRAGVDAVVVLL